VTSFFKTYYAPNNAIVAIAGDVDTAATLDRARKYFESIPPSRRRRRSMQPAAAAR
jgi:predicted Zn-dependent peptidase